MCPRDAQGVRVRGRLVLRLASRTHVEACGGVLEKGAHAEDWTSTTATMTATERGGSYDVAITCMQCVHMCPGPKCNVLRRIVSSASISVCSAYVYAVCLFFLFVQ